eukprot:s3374_g7.t1
MGLGYFARCAMERAQWGAGQLSRTYEQQGTHVRLVQRATEETTQEFDITGTPQKVSQGDGVVIQTTSWDEREAGVLLFETKDLLGNNPNSWTTSRQYLKGDELIIEVVGARTRCRRSDGAGKGVLSRRRYGAWRYFAVVVVHRLQLRSKEVHCSHLAAKHHALLLEIKQEIAADLCAQRLRQQPDEALASRLHHKVASVMQKFQLNSDDLGLQFRAVSPIIGTVLSGPVFHLRNFHLGIAGWQFLQLARGVERPSSVEDVSQAWDRSRHAFSELWAVAGRSPAESARRLDDLEKRQSFKELQKHRAIQQQRRQDKSRPHSSAADEVQKLQQTVSFGA